MMGFPESLKQLYVQCLEVVRNDPYHYLETSWRDKIYQNIALSPQGKRIAGWLDVLTARKIVPIWEEFERTTLSKIEEEWLSSEEINIEEELAAYQEYLDQGGKEIIPGDPDTMLQAAEDFLRGNMTIGRLSDLLSGYFYDGMMGLFNFATWTAYNAKDAAYSTVYSLVDSKHIGSVVEIALIAYAGIDKNPGGLWNWATSIDAGGFLAFLKDEEIRKDLAHSEAILIGNTPEGVFWLEIQSQRHERVKEIRNYIPIGADLDKALEFWEWWLNEAIPQAWKLGSEPL